MTSLECAPLCHVLGPHAIHQHVDGLELTRRHEIELKAEEHEVLERGVEVGDGPHALHTAVVVGVEDGEHTEQALEDATAHLVIIPGVLGIGGSGEHRLIVDDTLHPVQHMLDVLRPRALDRLPGVGIGPQVLEPRGETPAWLKTGLGLVRDDPHQ